MESHDQKVCEPRQNKLSERAIFIVNYSEEEEFTIKL